MEVTDQQPNGEMEQLLKKVYATHRDTLKGATTNLIKYKAAYSRAINKCHQLQRNNEELASENRKLSTVITTKQNRDGSCCEVIRQSLDTVISSYKQMLADKDARITQLEEEVNRLRRNPVFGTSKGNRENSLNLSNVSPSGHVDLHPDSTSCVTPKVAKQRQDAGPGSSGVSPVEELVFDTSPDDSAKLKLNRKRSKRSRYSEDISPDCKKPRKSSPTSQAVKAADNDIAKVSVNDKGLNKETKPTEQTKSRKVGKPGKGSGKVCKENHKVLVAETCVPDLNESLVSTGFSVKNGNTESEVQTVARKPADNSVLVIPETLAIDMDDTLQPEDVCDRTDGQKDGKFRPELTDIAEDCEESAQLNFHNKHGNLEKRKDEKKINATKEKLLDIPQSFRSILSSSESESSEGNVRHSDDLDLGRDSLAKDSDDDDESFFDSLPNSQTFSKSKSAVTSFNEVSGDISRTTRNACKNMKEVNALFETPESKGSPKETTDKSNQDVVTRKPLFKRGKKESLKNEVQSEVILRRSPRKHKPVTNMNHSLRTPTKAKTRLNNTISNTSPIKSARDHKEDESDVTEADLTLAPDQTNDHPEDNETETIDCYNVMPVKDGNLDPSRKFQVKVKGIKRSNNSVPQIAVLDYERTSAQTVGINDETLKSPSILDQDGRSRISGFSEVINVNSSSSASNGTNEDDIRHSDIDSPLIIRSDKYKEVIDEDLEIVDWNSAKGRRRNISNCSHNSLSLSTKRTSLRSSQQSDKFKKPGTVSKSGKSTPKGSHQTTLTQAFFSPKKNGTVNKNVDDVEENHCRTKASVDRRKQTPEFRSPRKGRLSKDKVKGHDNKDVETRQSVTVKDGHSVLVEIRGQNGEGRLNGSLDPSAELSEWCRDPETLPTLDTDFCEADLQADVNSLPKTSTLAVEDTQDIPCSSTSYKFLPRKQRKKDIENVDPKKAAVNMDNSFDRLPKKQGSDVAHVAVVRKRDERQKLQGHSCKECLQYYTSAGRTDEEIQQHMQKCSRHRAQFVPPDTPPHFWSVGFIETQDGNNTGIMKEDDLDFGEEQDIPSYRRRKRLNKYFTSKNERTVVEEDYQNTQQ